jgi:hypothetical protein
MHLSPAWCKCLEHGWGTLKQPCQFLYYTHVRHLLALHLGHRYVCKYVLVESGVHTLSTLLFVLWQGPCICKTATLSSGVHKPWNFNTCSPSGILLYILRLEF